MAATAPALARGAPAHSFAGAAPPRLPRVLSAARALASSSSGSGSGSTYACAISGSSSSTSGEQCSCSGRGAPAPTAAAATFAASPRRALAGSRRRLAPARAAAGSAEPSPPPPDSDVDGASASPPSAAGPSLLPLLQRSWAANSSVVLFLGLGSAITALLYAWACGDTVRTGRPYTAHIRFERTPNLARRTPLRMKGVQVGQVVAIVPHLEHVDVTVQVNDVTIVLPRAARYDMTESGMFVDPFIDVIVPEGVDGDALRAFSPLAPPGSAASAHIVLAGETVRGAQGGSFNDLVKIMTRLQRGDAVAELGRKKGLEVAANAASAPAWQPTAAAAAPVRQKQAPPAE